MPKRSFDCGRGEDHSSSNVILFAELGVPTGVSSKQPMKNKQMIIITVVITSIRGMPALKTLGMFKVFPEFMFIAYTMTLFLWFTNICESIRCVKFKVS